MRAQRPTRWVPRGTRSCRRQDFRDVASAVKTTKAPASSSKSSLSDFVTPADCSLAAAVGPRLWSCQLTIKDLVLSVTLQALVLSVTLQASVLSVTLQALVSSDNYLGFGLVWFLIACFQLGDRLGPYCQETLTHPTTASSRRTTRPSPSSTPACL